MEGEPEAVISWKAQKQKCVATSSFHAELIAASEGAKDLIHCDAVASDLTGEPSHEPVPMYVDNKKALVDVAYNPEHHDKTRGTSPTASSSSARQSRGRP